MAGVALAEPATRDGFASSCSARLVDRMGTLTCQPCGNPFSDRLTQCPHCGRSAVAYPNVLDATRPQERDALAQRVAAAKARATSRGVDGLLERLEHDLGRSRAVRTVRSHEIERLVSSDHAAMSTYYRQLQGGFRLPETSDGGPDWDRLRRIAESAAFSTYTDEIQFAALTIDDGWLSSYGDAALFLREDCIAHRASVFEDNIVLWMQAQGPVWEIPPGYRAPWESRAALGVAKLADEVAEGVDLAQLVLHAGAKTSDDSMLEVHVYGSMTIRSIASIEMREGRISEQFRQELDERAAECGFGWRAVS